MAGSAAAHLVQFYSSTSSLAESLGSLFAEPLLHGETVVVVADPEHREALDVALAGAGVNLAAEYKSSRYVPVDAHEALSAFMTPAGPDAERFRAVLGATVLEARRRTGTVHAYGEMVGVLAARGDLVAALELETLWDQLLAQHPFRLLCGYPRDIVGDATPAFDSIVARHDAVIISRDPAEPALVASVDIPIGPDAADTARRTAADVLSAWGATDAAGRDAAGVVVSEFVAAACRHGSQRISLSLGLEDGQVVVAVTDAAMVLPRTASAPDLLASGRCFALLSSVAQAWGVETLPEGSRLWARLPRASRA